MHVPGSLVVLPNFIVRYGHAAMHTGPLVMKLVGTEGFLHMGFASEAAIRFHEADLHRADVAF